MTDLSNFANVPENVFKNLSPVHACSMLRASYDNARRFTSENVDRYIRKATDLFWKRIREYLWSLYQKETKVNGLLFSEMNALLLQKFSEHTYKFKHPIIEKMVALFEEKNKEIQNILSDGYITDVEKLAQIEKVVSDTAEIEKPFDFNDFSCVYEVKIDEPIENALEKTLELYRQGKIQSTIAE